MSYRRASGFLLAGFVLTLAGSGPAGAEMEIFGLKASGDVEVGGRVFVDEPRDKDKGYFEEYRDLPESAFLPYLRLRGDSKDDFYTVEIRAKNGGQDDQNFQLRSYGVGRFNFLFEWDQTPHLFSTTGRTFFVEGADNVFTLPTPRPTPLTVWNAAPRIDEIEFRTDTARIAGSYMPTPEWDLNAEYRRIHKGGERPIALSFGTPGNNVFEVAPSIDESIHDATVSAGFAGDGYQLQFSYNLSLFENGFDSFTTDNPCFANAACSASNQTVERGRGSLPPDNVAHTFTLAGGVNLPMRTRVNSSVSYSWQLQSEDFLPHTINPAIVDPGLALPESDLDASVGILRFNLSATSRPLDPVTISTRYRLFRRDDDTDELTFPSQVVDDRNLSTTPITAHRHSYTRHNAGVDVGYKIAKPVSAKVGFDWEHWNRDTESREVDTTNEYTPKLVLDVMPIDWALLRTSYSRSIRRGSDYDQVSDLQIPGIRKFTMANRDRDRVEVLGELSPWDNVTFTTTYSIVMDDYDDSDFGLQEQDSWAVGIDASWRPREWLTIFAGYVHEEFDAKQRSRDRPGAPPPADFPDFDWVADTEDVIDTVRVGFDAILLPKKLDFGANWSLSYARNKMKAQNPTTPVSGTPGQNADATAGDLPDIKNTLSYLNVFLRYWLSERFTAKLAYAFEVFEKTDFRTDDTQPFMVSAGANTILLGNDLRDYTAHYFTLSVAYHF